MRVRTTPRWKNISKIIKKLLALINRGEVIRSSPDCLSSAEGTPSQAAANLLWMLSDSRTEMKTGKVRLNYKEK